VSNQRPSSRASFPAGMTSENQRARAVLQGLGVHDRRVLAAVQTVPERLFELNRPGQAPSDATSGPPIPFTTLVALMVQALELRGDERVLDVGTGSGYQAALLGRLAREVYSVELEPGISEAAQRTLSKLGFDNVHVATGDASKGWPSAAPYQAIVVGAASTYVPGELIEQLDEGGRLVIAIGDERGQLVERLRKGRQSLESEVVTWCALPPLVFAQPRSPSSRPWMKAPQAF
jgi:protein-L-isoaspartate(D-aspartate) O-methyltransferase